MTILYVLFWLSAFIVFWGMIGYRLCLKLLSRFFSDRRLKKDYSYKPVVSVMIVAHNEEKVIGRKLDNILENDYPKDKIEYVVASDWSTDKTNEIVKEYIKNHSEAKIRLNCSKEHKGKTNAQNEAQKITTGEILVMSDANAMFEPNAITELVASFTAPDIVYVSGRLSYVNSENATASAESSYWEDDLKQRETESNIKTITAGNGAIYACRNAMYYDFDPLYCHDSIMPYKFGKEGKRCLYNPEAVAYEKAGEVNEDEFKRKIRMNRYILQYIVMGSSLLNPFKYGWFGFFYFGHRLCRYLLWAAHIVLLIVSLIGTFFTPFFACIFCLQLLFYILAIISLKTKPKNRILKMMGYYTMTILAQAIGAYREATGKSKPTWNKAESTR